MNRIFQPKTFADFVRLILVWRIWLFVISYISVFFIIKNSYPFPYTDSILTPTQLPKWIWGFANFDGVHYIRTALWGYSSEYSQAFFPLYPILMYLLNFWNIFELNSLLVLLVNGLIISFFGFVGALFFCRKILVFDYPKEVVEGSILLVLFFPTSFFFGAVYTESLFLLLSCAAIYLILRKYYLYAGILIAFATATRITGVFLILIYLIEMFRELKVTRHKEHAFDLFSKLFGLFISVSGLILYMFFLYYNYNNPLYFLTAQPVFGASRQVDQLVVLPQVFFRYIKILLTVPFFTSQFFSAVIELIFSLFGLFLLIISFKRVRFSYWLFSFCVYLLPTLTGTLSSMPRYVLLQFLLFPSLVLFLKGKTKVVLILFIFLQIFFCALFTLGFWIA